MKTLVFFTFIVCSLGCTKNKSPKDIENTPTGGYLHITVDESFKPLFESEVYTFNSSYTNANIEVVYKTEYDAIGDFLEDSSQLVVVTRTLTEDENKYFNQIKLLPRLIPVGIDAVCLILHRNNSDTNLTYQQVVDIFNGKIQRWKQINPQSQLDTINLVFDHKNSSSVRYIMDSVLWLNKFGKQFPPKSFAKNSFAEVINYVKEVPSAIGIVAVNWISDRDDSVSMNFLKKIRVVGIKPSDTSNGKNEFYQPYQSYIKQRYYPLCRPVYILHREARAGLATGFSAFISGDRGQRIILKSGLVPVRMPTREIKIN